MTYGAEKDKKASVLKVFAYKHKGQSLHIFTFLSWLFCQLAKNLQNIHFYQYFLKIELYSWNERVVFFKKLDFENIFTSIPHSAVKTEEFFPLMCGEKTIKSSPSNLSSWACFHLSWFHFRKQKEEGRECFEMNHVKTRRQWQISLNSNILAAESL